MRSRTLIPMLLVIVALLSGCAASQIENDSSLMDAAYPELADKANLTVDQHERLGDRLADEGRFDLAYMQYEKAMAQLPEDNALRVTLRVKIGMLMMAQGQDEQALHLFQEILAADPEHPLANEATGAVYLKAGLNSEAEIHLTRALAADPNLFRAHHYMGILHSQSKRTDLAIQEFTTSLALSPGRAGTLNNLGVALLMRGEYQRALSVFRQALSAGAPKAKTYNNIGLALARMNHHSDALQAFKYAGGEAKAYNNLGYVLMSQGDIHSAISYFEKAIQVSPNYYAKAFENLKQARMALSFQDAGLNGRTPLPSTIQPEMIPEPAAGDPLPADAAPVAVPTPAPAQPATPTNQSSITAPSAKQYPDPVDRFEYTNAAVNHGIRLTTAGGPDLLGKSLSLRGNVRPASVHTVVSNTLAVATAPSRSIATAPSPSTVSVPTAPRAVYGFHVASYRHENVAKTEAQQVEQRGFSSNVIRVDLGSKGIWYRVMAGSYATSADARAARSQARAKLGLDKPVIKSFMDTTSTTPPEEVSVL